MPGHMVRAIGPMAQVVKAGGLPYVHEHAVVHRDVKPGELSSDAPALSAHGIQRRQELPAAQHDGLEAPNSA